MSGKRFEWRVCWENSITIDFRGEGDWQPYVGDENDVDSIRDALMVSDKGYDSSLAFDAFMNETGTSWSVDVREVAGDE